jgi:hypothetical protein
MMPVDAAYSAAREMLRHRHHPQRLLKNALIRAWLAGLSETPQDDEILIAALNRDVREAIQSMPERHSQILRRCDFEGSSHREVMGALGLSERHFYRERRAAIVELARRLQQHPTIQRVRAEPDRLALCFARADALESAGRIDDALGMLSNLRGAVADEERGRIEARLAEVNRDAGRFEAALEHVRACTHVTCADDARTELDVLRATIAWQAGEGSCTTSSLDGSIECLRERARRRTPALIPHALSDALEISGEASLESSDWTRALSLFDEARTALAVAPEPRRDVMVRALIWGATARSWIDRGLPTAARELESAYAMACAQSLPREASLALGRLCQLFDLLGNAKRAAELATTYLEPIAAQLVGDWRAAAHLDIASTCISTGQPAKAAAQLQLAKAAAPPGSFAYAASLMGDSEIALAMRDAPAAIEHANGALAEMVRLGRLRHVGAVLAVRAEALWLGGHQREASTQMYDALDLMRRYAHPLRLATQYRRAVRVTNNRAHARAARELWNAHAVRL